MKSVYKVQLSLVEKYTIQRVLLSFFFLVINVISLINKSNTIFIYLLMPPLPLLLQSLNCVFPRSCCFCCSTMPFARAHASHLLVGEFYFILSSGNLQHLLLSDIHSCLWRERGLLWRVFLLNPAAAASNSTIDRSDTQSLLGTKPPSRTLRN